jgi:hypothetical protein
MCEVAAAAAAAVLFLMRIGSHAALLQIMLH